MRSELGLDKPFLERYVNYIWDLLHGDFGKSYKTKLSVSDQILSRFPNTILLALSSMLIALLLGIPLGILSAKKQYSLLDNVASVGGLISVSMPNFWLGLLLVILREVNIIRRNDPRIVGDLLDIALTGYGRGHRSDA